MAFNKKVIIVGCGFEGSRIAQILESKGFSVVIIDTSYESLEKLKNFKGKKILGDGCDELVLKKAGIEEADVFIAVTNSDNINLMSSQMARAVFDVSKVICRVYDPKKAEIYSEFGMDIVNPSQSNINMFLSYVLTDASFKKYQLGDGSVIALEIPFNESSGRSVSELEVEGKFRVCAILRGVKVLIANPNTKVKKGDRLFGVVAVEDMKDTLEKVGLCFEDGRES